MHVFNDGFETLGSVVHFAKLKLSLGSEVESHRFTEVVSLNQRRAMEGNWQPSKRYTSGFTF